MKIKHDKYLENRGGYTKIIHLSCASCGKKLGGYQKDDPSPITGVLKRLYPDRCDQKLLNSFPWYKSGARWDCPKCDHYLGFAALYRKERRRSWYLLIDTIIYEE